MYFARLSRFLINMEDTFRSNQYRSHCNSMAEGRGFEPPVGLPLLLISSQMPLTTQPPFHRETIVLRFSDARQADLSIHCCESFEVLPEPPGNRTGFFLFFLVEICAPSWLLKTNESLHFAPRQSGGTQPAFSR